MLYGIIFALTVDVPVPDHSFQIAIISTAGVVISAALGAFALVFQKHREQLKSTPTYTETPLSKELRRQIAALNKTVSEKNRVITSKNRRIEQLEDYLWVRGINPNTNRPVEVGENDPSQP